MKIGVIGIGYIGLNTSLFFAYKGAKVIGIDVDENKINLINNGQLPIPELIDWLPFNYKKAMKNVTATADFDILLNQKDIDAIFIAVPTEQNGEPYFEALNNVIREIYNSPNKDNLIIVESTLMPGVSDTHIKPCIKNFAIAPRRDWFEIESNKNLQTLPRIVGGSNEESTQRAIKIIGKVCKNLIPCDYREAELVKATENSIRHLGCVYAQELALAFPHLDIRKILKLASTKWNVPEYHPAISTGGYCIPLSSRYIIKSAEERNKHYLSISRSIIGRDDSMPEIILSHISSNLKIGILGVSYLGNIKVNILSSGSRLIKEIQNKRTIRIHDPLYTSKELRKKYNCPTFEIPNDFDEVDCVILTAGHDYYKNINKQLLIEKTKHLKFILDNSGIWEGIEFECPYALIGRAGWLNTIRSAY